MGLLQQLPQLTLTVLTSQISRVGFLFEFPSELLFKKVR